MTYQLQARANKLAKAFMEGRMHDITRYYAENLIVFGNGGVLQFFGHAEIAAAMVKHREHALDAGMISLRGEVFAEPIFLQGRYKIFARWHYNMGDHVAPRVSEKAYYCTGPRGQEKIEVVQLRQLAFPEAMSWYEANNLYHAREYAA